MVHNSAGCARACGETMNIHSSPTTTGPKTASRVGLENWNVVPTSSHMRPHVLRNFAKQFAHARGSAPPGTTRQTHVTHSKTMVAKHCAINQATHRRPQVTVSVNLIDQRHA